MPASILDVLDNFFGPANMDVHTAPGTAIHELCEHVRAFAASEHVGVDPTQPAVYLGGWPSANFWTVGGDLLLTSLLYSHQLLVRDPISDWFSLEQYKLRHMMSARPGYLDRDGQPNVGATRAFLAGVMPQLELWRPLIESGVVVLTTAESNALTHRTEIEQLHQRLETSLLTNPVSYAEQFTPGEIAVEDNVRGSFVFAGGDHLRQLHRAQSAGLYHFAREYVLATSNGAVYTAPFRHEQHVCRDGLAKVLLPSERVVTALLRTGLPVFAGLTPSVINKIHNDDSFAAFRAELHTAYQCLPVNQSDEEIDGYLRDQESALLAPAIMAAQRSVDRGPIGRLGVALTNNVFALAATIATGAILKDPLVATAAGLAGALGQGLASTRHADGTGQRVWNALTRHNRSAREEMSGVTVASTGAPTRWWGIREVASMEVTVSAGALLIDHFPQPGEVAGLADPTDREFEDGIYRRCECGSGRKYKFCCRDLATVAPVSFSPRR